jgi:hypothetical protein
MLNICYVGLNLAIELCPFCDDQLPKNPSKQLRQMIARASQYATPCPTPLNPKHLDASFLQHVDVCARHE